MMKLNDRIQESLTEIYLMSDKYVFCFCLTVRIINDLLDALRENIIVLYRVSESLAYLDMLAAMSKYALDAKSGALDFSLINVSCPSSLWCAHGSAQRPTPDPRFHFNQRHDGSQRRVCRQ